MTSLSALSMSCKRQSSALSVSSMLLTRSCDASVLNRASYRLHSSPLASFCGSGTKMAVSTAYRRYAPSAMPSHFKTCFRFIFHLLIIKLMPSVYHKGCKLSSGAAAVSFPDRNAATFAQTEISRKEVLTIRQFPTYTVGKLKIPHMGIVFVPKEESN